MGVSVHVQDGVAAKRYGRGGESRRDKDDYFFKFKLTAERLAG
jgi:hypothetical protein